LTGSVAEFGGRHVELLLIGDDGYVSYATKLLRSAGDTKTFSFKPHQEKSGPPQPQLLFAIASSKPLEMLKLLPDGSRADEVFGQVLTEMQRSGQTLKVGWKLFMLEKVEP
jgi:hypothetical protein